MADLKKVVDFTQLTTNPESLSSLSGSKSRSSNDWLEIGIELIKHDIYEEGS